MRHYFVLGCATVLALSGCGRAENSLLLLEDLPEVASITIEGNHRFGDGTLKGLMTVREGTWWNPFRDHKFRKGQLKSDLSAILTYYMRHGYLSAQIEDQEVRSSGDEVHITIRIREGDPVTTSDVVIRGARALNPNNLRTELAVKPDHPFDPFALQDDRLLILRSLAGIGYWNARVRANVQFFENRALVFYLLEEGEPVSVRKVTVSGNRDVREEQVRRNISVKPGAPLRYGELVKSQTRLLQSGYFSDAQWDTAGLDTLTGDIEVNFRVRERRLHWFELGLGFSSQEQLGLGGEWGTRNLLGTGMRFAVNTKTELDLAGDVTTLVNYHRTDFLLNKSHIFGTSWEAQPGVSYLNIRESVQDSLEYRQNIIRAALTFRRRFGDLRNQVVTGIENRWVFNRADSAAAAADSLLGLDSYTTRLLWGLVERDTRNTFFSPTAGAYQRVLLQVAGLGGNNGFVKTSVANSWFHRVPVGAWALATRLQLGYTIPTAEAGADQITVELVPPEDRFFLGGANTVRGYQQSELDGRLRSVEGLPEGGLAEFLLNVEVRVPLIWKLGAVAFLDGGNVWQDRHQISLDRLVPRGDPDAVDPLDVRYTYGLGLRLATPVGPVRLDYARKWNVPAGSVEERDKWHFALGQAF